MSLFPLQGHGKYEAYLEVGSPVAETGEGVLHESTGEEGDILVGVDGTGVR